MYVLLHVHIRDTEQQQLGDGLFCVVLDSPKRTSLSVTVEGKDLEEAAPGQPRGEDRITAPIPVIDQATGTEHSKQLHFIGCYCIVLHVR